MKISLCIIVRNEEDMLAACLASVKGVVDEIVVVDTGSSDGTRRIAERAGARVFETPWRDDFSGPRNLSIAKARGEWILQLDADERLAPGSGDRIKEAVARSDFDCGLIRLHNASSPEASADDVIRGRARLGEAMSLPRLLRRTPDLAYVGIVHESVMQWIRGGGRRVQFVDADIVHLGSLPEVRRNRNKVSRNVDLLKKRAANEPNDFTAYSYLAFEALAQGEIDEASRAAEAGWAIVLRGCQAPGVSVLRLAVARALIQKQRNDHHGVLETVRVAEHIDGPHPDLCMLRGTALEMLARAFGAGSKLRRAHLERALEAHRAALALGGVDYVQRFLIGAGSWASLTRAGTVLLQLQGSAAAFDTLETAVALKSDDREAALGLAEAEIATATPEAALARLEPLLGSEPDGWVLAALACDRLGAIDDVLGFVRQASQRASNGYLSTHRKELHLDLMGLVAAYAGSPAVGPGPVGALGALMAHKPFEEERLHGWDISVLPLQAIVRNLVQAGRFGLLDALLTPRAEAAFPGLTEGVLGELRGLGLDVGRDDSPQPIVVCSDDVDAAKLVERILSAHPRMCGRGLLERAEDPTSGDATRDVFWARSLVSAQDLTATLPRRTLLVVSVSAEESADAPTDGSIVLSYRALLDEPVMTIARLLARLDESADDKPLRTLIENYPGRRRASRPAAEQDRAHRAGRASSDQVRAALGEVSP